jgi:hypothetical protein
MLAAGLIWPEVGLGVYWTKILSDRAETRPKKIAI